MPMSVEQMNAMYMDFVRGWTVRTEDTYYCPCSPLTDADCDDVDRCEEFPYAVA